MNNFVLITLIRHLLFPPVLTVSSLVTDKSVFYIISILDENSTVHFSTADHKPTNLEEKQRITAAGGVVITQRINGSLAVSRALGDFDYK